jgi:hypothetical protein
MLIFVKVFFDYSSVANSMDGVQINNTRFSNNTAFGQLCSIAQAGTGGAIGIVGVAIPPVLLSNVTLEDNVATRPSRNRAVSLGGAIAASLSSNVSVYASRFLNNFALYGVGNDVISITATTHDSNYIYFYNTEFQSVSSALPNRISTLMNRTVELCNDLSEFIDTYDNLDFTPSWRRRLVQSDGDRIDLVETLATFVEDGAHVVRVVLFGDEHFISVSSNTWEDKYNALVATVKNLELSFRHVDHGEMRRVLLNDLEKLHASSKQHFKIESTATPINSFDLFNFLPGIALTAGASILEECTFSGRYHMFVGSYTTIVSNQNGGDDLGLSQLPCDLKILGNISSDDLAITMIGANVLIDLFDDHDDVKFREINIFNGTLTYSCDIAIGSTSFLYSAELIGTNSIYDSDQNSLKILPTVTFEDDLLTGYTLVQAASSNRDSFISVIHFHSFNFTTNSTAQSVLVFRGCNVVVAGTMYLDSPYRGIDAYGNFSDGTTYTFSNCKVEMKNNATLLIANSGTLALFTSTSIVSDSFNTPALINNGNISLLGAAASPFDRNNLFNDYAAIGSLSSILSIYGNFVQNSTGTINIVLNTSGQSIPVINLVSAFEFGGVINVSFKSSPSLTLYDTDKPPTSFTIVSYQNNTFNKYSSGISPTIISPAGLGFAEQSSYSSLTSRFQEQLVVENIACNQINTDYQGVPNSLNVNLYPCYVCLQNSSCEFCSGGGGVSARCAPRGTCTSSTIYTSQCCSHSCNPPYGYCAGSDGNTKFSCECTGWFYRGNNCDELSLYAIVIIFSGTFLVTTFLLSLFLYRRSLTQKQQVLEELREGILRHTETANNEYIQNMQQALILNDVFVKFEEIKLESKVGEGSFGVVHKATFRGAQVAVKQMRSMFFELTEKEIDEFRREAYVMSR